MPLESRMMPFPLSCASGHAKSPLGCFPGASGQPIIEK